MAGWCRKGAGLGLMDVKPGGSSQRRRSATRRRRDRLARRVLHAPAERRARDREREQRQGQRVAGGAPAQHAERRPSRGRVARRATRAGRQRQVEGPAEEQLDARHRRQDDGRVRDHHADDEAEPERVQRRVPSGRPIDVATQAAPATRQHRSPTAGRRPCSG